jgi:hypothetical protein
LSVNVIGGTVAGSPAPTAGEPSSDQWVHRRDEESRQAFLVAVANYETADRVLVNLRQRRRVIRGRGIAGIAGGFFRLSTSNAACTTSRRSLLSSLPAFVGRCRARSYSCCSGVRGYRSSEGGSVRDALEEEPHMGRSGARFLTSFHCVDVRGSSNRCK